MADTCGLRTTLAAALRSISPYPSPERTPRSRSRSSRRHALDRPGARPYTPRMNDTVPADAASATERARVLSQALPFLRRYAGATIVVKYGGHAMGEEDLALQFGSDIALLKQVGVNPVVVHGGGPQINAMLKRLAIQSTFVDG